MNKKIKYLSIVLSCILILLVVVVNDSFAYLVDTRVGETQNIEGSVIVLNTSITKTNTAYKFEPGDELLSKGIKFSFTYDVKKECQIRVKLEYTYKGQSYQTGISDNDNSHVYIEESTKIAGTPAFVRLVDNNMVYYEYKDIDNSPYVAKNVLGSATISNIFGKVYLSGKNIELGANETSVTLLLKFSVYVKQEEPTWVQAGFAVGEFTV